MVLSAKPTDWTPEVNYHISSSNGRKFSIMQRTSCSSLSRVLSTRSSCSTSPTSPTSLSQDNENFYFCVQQQCEVRIWVNKHKDTCYKTQSQDDEQAWGNSLPRKLPWGKDVTGKEFTLTSWKSEITNCRRATTTWTPCWRRTGEAIRRAAKNGRIDNSRAQSLNWDLWIWETNHRYAVVGQNLAA